MPKSDVLDDRARRGLNEFIERHGYDFPLGDWIQKVDLILAKLDSDTGVADTDYEATLGND